jgi:hypothetical protein
MCHASAEGADAAAEIPVTIRRASSTHIGFDTPVDDAARPSRDALTLKLCGPAASRNPAIARTILVALGLAHQPTAFLPARAPARAELDGDNAS